MHDPLGVGIYHWWVAETHDPLDVGMYHMWVAPELHS